MFPVASGEGVVFGVGLVFGETVGDGAGFGLVRGEMVGDGASLGMPGAESTYLFSPCIIFNFTGGGTVLSPISLSRTRATSEMVELLSKQFLINCPKVELEDILIPFTITQSISVSNDF
jgi:hypothetical protein